MGISIMAQNSGVKIISDNGFLNELDGNSGVVGAPVFIEIKMGALRIFSQS
jgi:hypothetical protein